MATNPGRSTSEPYKRKADSKMDVDFLVSPTISCQNYNAIPFDPKNPRAIPFPDGAFGDNPFVQISNEGTTVTFQMQQGSTLDAINGTHPEAVILFAKSFLEEKNKGDFFNRHTSMAVTDLENANLHLLARAADRHARRVQGSYKA